VRSKSSIIVAGSIALAVSLAGGVYAYDHARGDRIAPGVSVGGVPIGNLTRAEARARLQRQILDPLSRPIVVRHGDRAWSLDARDARIRADLGAMVDEAVARTRTGDIVSRVWRTVTAEPAHVDLQPRIDYSQAAVARLVAQVGAALRRPARDATVTLSGAGVDRTPSRPGRALDAAPLTREIRAAIVSRSAPRTFTARTRSVAPRVTDADLARRYGTVLIVNRSQFRLRLYKRLKLARTYPIAVGMAGLETPAGQYAIANKAKNPAWHVPDSDWAGKLAGKTIPGDDPTNPIKARWLGIYDGVGIHGTSDDASIGHNASHGCIRMHVPDVEKLYDEVPVGAAIYIA
jgi:lipoprotein-anchoring transpeptidase ErfK/SrfK